MTNELEIKVPDIGGAASVDVIEILVKPGDRVEKETPLVTLESDKASMEIPSPCAGVISQIKLKVGDKVSQGDVIALAQVSGEQERATPSQEQPSQLEQEQVSLPKETSNLEKPSTAPEVIKPQDNTSKESVAATPSVRRYARELGVDIAMVLGSGRNHRILKEDVQLYVKAKINEPASGLGMPSAPVVDFSKFGEIEIKPFNKIKKLTAVNVHRSWITIPHVTQFDEADITNLEAFRKSESARESEFKLTLLAFVCRVVAKALFVYPQFNSSLHADGEQIIYKKYCNIGIAVETPNGLVVPVIKDVNKLSVIEIAQKMSELSAKARSKTLSPADMSGGCFTISSLGGIGGTAFTPIVNSPEVAILGLSRSLIKPVYEKEQWIPQLMLPVSLSYDHRVIDGAEAARFTRYICECLADIRKIIL